VSPSAEALGAAPEVAPWLAQSRDWPTVGEGPLPSAHLGRLHRAEIHVSPAARKSYLALVTDTQFAEGTWLVEFLKDARTGAKGPIFALERRSDGWAYWELDPQGRVRAEGALAFCAGCHAGAPAAPVFGLPRTPSPQESNAAAARSVK